MDDQNNTKGYFTKNLFSIRLQLETLLDGVGSKDACQFLDQLSELSETERGIILRVFKRALTRLSQSGVSVKTLRDEQLEEFEETLYENLIDGMNAYKGGRSSGSFSVVDGGKLPPQRRPQPQDKMINLAEARKKRQKKLSDSPILN